MSWIALDIGGANVKAADGRGWARSAPFPLWREPERLPAVLAELINAAPASDRVAVTMTGELCDCFRTKAEGVAHILDAARQAAADRGVRVYLVDGRLVPIDEAHRLPNLAAASNWHVLARFAGRFAEQGPALLIDIGSTTTDVVPLMNGVPQPRGLTDTERLVSRELVYCGVGRTPICALVSWLPWRNMKCPVAAELFATTADAYVLLGEVAEQPDSTNTADGRPLTREFSQERLARMICADSASFTLNDAMQAAVHIQNSQLERLNHAVREAAKSLPDRPRTVVVAGEGEFLADAVCRQVWHDVPRVSQSELIGHDASKCAPAHALAVLAREGL